MLINDSTPAADLTDLQLLCRVHSNLMDYQDKPMPVEKCRFVSGDTAVLLDRHGLRYGGVME
jgi:hypothetical protein